MKTNKKYIKEITKQYDELAEIWNYFPISAKKNVDVFVEKSPKKGGKLLDVGCASGRAISRLANRFEKSYGIDISPGMIECAKKEFKSRKNFIFKTQDARDMKFPKNNFDYIISHTTLHHLSIEDQESVLDNIKNITKPNGKVVIIEIVNKGLMKYRPDISRRIGASITLIIEFIKLNRNAYSNYKKATNPLWMAHLRMDRFLSEKKFIEVYRSTFKNAKFTNIRREYGLNNLVIMEWIKPSK